MFATGIILVIIGLLLFAVLNPSEYSWTRRDIYALPLTVGVLLMAFSLAVWAWYNMP
jgi:hypothetical protein